MSVCVHGGDACQGGHEMYFPNLENFCTLAPLKSKKMVGRHFIDTSEPPPEEAEPVETKHATSRTWPHVSESRSLTLVIWCENHTTLKRQVFGCAHGHQTSQPASPERTTVRELLRSGSLLERWKRSGRFRGKYVVNYGLWQALFPCNDIY